MSIRRFLHSAAILAPVSAALLITYAAQAADYPASREVASVSEQASQVSAAPKAYVGLFKDNAVGVIDTSTNRQTTTIPIPEGPHGLVITPDGKKVYVSSDGASTVSVIDTSSDRVVSSIDVGQTPHGLSISKDGRIVVVSGFGSNQEEIIDTTSDRVTATYPVASPHNSAISADSRMLYVGSQQQDATAIVVLDLVAGAQVASVPVSDQPRALNLSPDGSQLYFTLVGSDAVHVLDPTTNEEIGEIPVGASPHLPLFTPDGYFALVVAQGPGELDVVDTADQDIEARVSVGTFPHWIGLSSDGNIAYVSNEGSNDVSVVDLSSRTVTSTIQVGNAPRKIAVQPGAIVPAVAGGNDGPSFETTGSGQRISLGDVTYWDHGAQDVRGQTTLTLTADDYFFTPTFLQGEPGQSLTIQIQNTSGTKHNFSMTGQADQDLAPRSGAFVEVTFPQSGGLRFFCKYHTALGMNGQLLQGDANPQAAS